MTIHNALPPERSLVERVSYAIDRSICPDQWLHQDAARAAIREVVVWLIDRKRQDDWLAPFDEVAKLLEQEAEQ